MQDLSGKMAKGAAWMVAARLSDRIIGLSSTIILARLLVPEDFGLVVIATAIITALQLLSAFSFDLALIQNPHAGRRHYDTVWTINLLFSALFTLLLVALGKPAAHFYAEPRLADIMYVLAVGTLLGGFLNVGIVDFRKEMQFHKEFNLVLAKKVCSAIVTVTLAVLWRDCWALIAGLLTAIFVEVTLSYVLHPYRPRLSLAARHELFTFSRWLFVNNLLAFLYHRAADFILAKGVGTGGVGYYSVAYEISNLPSTELVAPVNRAVFPGYARISDDIAAIRRGFLSVLAVLALIAIPAAVGLACIAEMIVTLMLGANWNPSVPLIQMLALNGVLAAVLSCSGYVFIAIGKPRYITVLVAIHVVLAIPMMTWAALRADIEAAALSVLLASLIVFPFNVALLRRAIRVNAMNLIQVLWRPILGSLAMAAVIRWLDMPYAAKAGAAELIMNLFIVVTCGALTYCCAVLLLWWLSSQPPGAEAFVRDRAKKLFSQLCTV